MKSMAVGEIKTNFSEVLDEVQKGVEYQILFGRAKKPVAKIVPIEEEPRPRKLGILQGIASFTLGDDFKFRSEEEFLGL
jgi:antitoxin (DNA-binding transcriptional repressor) of toxin-antitoxin stability system